MAERVTASAPGRVNLIGEHTDYHEGYVLPTVIPQRTSVEVAGRGDGRVRVRSSATGNVTVEYELGRETRQHDWIDYVMGITTALSRRGVTVRGFDAQISSTVPVGAGVSSSAALEISLLRALRELLNLTLSDVELALIGREAENDFVGAPVGVMDQMAASLGHDGEALFIDTRTLHTQRLPLPPTMRLLVIDSGITHAHAEGAYASRRQESFAAAAQLGIPFLRDATADLDEQVMRLPEPLNRRARHVISENARVLEAVAALQRGDGAGLGALCNASHASMRDDYEITTPEIDTLVSIAQARDDVFGARMTGGGFGGAIVVIATGAANHDSARAIADRYGELTNQHATVLVPAH